MLNDVRGFCGRSALWFACALMAAGAPFAHAQDADPPGRVARVNVIEGQASVQLAGDNDWTSDVINRPLTTGDKVWVDNSSRAEMHIGSTGVRMGAQTGVELLNVDDRGIQLRLSAGSMNIRVRSLQSDESVEVDTPNVSVALLRAGEYRLDVDDNGDLTSVSVINGAADVTSPQQNYRLDPRDRGEFRGGDPVDGQVSDLSGPDALDLWAEQRDAREDRAVSAQYVSREVPGYSDLDDYGSWSDDATYGPIWAPRVAYGWAPYHSGHWVWISPWGWTWVDDAPWGFAPFHYGRWVNIDNRWCWSPGRHGHGPRPVYAPALVAWVGGGSVSVGISIGGGRGGVGWFPLGYNEIYRPAYRVSNNYVRNVNVTNTYITNTTVINNTTIINNPRYANQRVPGAVAAVSHDTFVSARPVGRNLVHVDQRMIAGAASSTSSIAIAPTERSHVREPRDSFQNARAAAPAAAIFARPTVSRRDPPPRPASFEVQRQAVIANGARPVPVQALPRAQAAAPVRIVRPDASRQDGRQDVRQDGRQSPAFNAAPPRNDRPAEAVRPIDRYAHPVQPAPVMRPAPDRPAPVVQPDRPQPIERSAPNERRSDRPAIEDFRVRQQPQQQQQPQQPSQQQERGDQQRQLQQQRDQQAQQQRAEAQQRSEVQQQRAEMQQRAEAQQREQRAQQPRAEAQPREQRAQPQPIPAPRAQPQPQPQPRPQEQPRAEPPQPRGRGERGDRGN